MSTIKRRERDIILQSLKSGMVPRIGQQHIQVGRNLEIQALVSDLDSIVDGGASARFIIGDYGSGKTFFMHLVRAVALDKGLVTAYADLNPDRRLQAAAGQARNLYSELMKNLATKTQPEGNALQAIVERFVTRAIAAADEQGVAPDQIISERLHSLQELLGGYDFAHVIGQYWEGHEAGDDDKKTNAIRWLRGEYATKTDARMDLGVRTIVEDHTIYDHIKLLSRFVLFAGYNGLLIGLDEMVNIYKLQHAQSRTANYEQLLRILNDCLSGSAQHLGFLFGGTPEFLMDPRRGVYSYEALQSRLAENTFLKPGMVDYSGPIIRLSSLTPEDLYVLLEKLRNVYAGGDPSLYLVPDEAIQQFMQHSLDRIGEEYFRTPRTTIKSFLDFLSILDQNPDSQWPDILPDVQVEHDTGIVGDTVTPDEEPDDELAAYTI